MTSQQVTTKGARILSSDHCRCKFFPSYQSRRRIKALTKKLCAKVIIPVCPALVLWLPVKVFAIVQKEQPTSSLSQARLIISSWIRRRRLNFPISSLRLSFCWGEKRYVNKVQTIKLSCKYFRKTLEGIKITVVECKPNQSQNCTIERATEKNIESGSKIRNRW